MLTHEKWAVLPRRGPVRLGLFPVPENVRETTVGSKGEKLLWISRAVYYIALLDKGGDEK